VIDKIVIRLEYGVIRAYTLSRGVRFSGIGHFASPDDLAVIAALRKAVSDPGKLVKFPVLEKQDVCRFPNDSLNEATGLLQV
jgi:hypothetical protein